MLEILRDKLQNELARISEGNHTLRERLKSFNDTYTQEKEKVENLKQTLYQERGKASTMKEVPASSEKPKAEVRYLPGKTISVKEISTQTDLTSPNDHNQPVKLTRRNTQNSNEPKSGTRITTNRKESFMSIEQTEKQTEEDVSRLALEENSILELKRDQSKEMTTNMKDYFSNKDSSFSNMGKGGSQTTEPQMTKVSPGRRASIQVKQPERTERKNSTATENFIPVVAETLMTESSTSSQVQLNVGGGGTEDVFEKKAKVQPKGKIIRGSLGRRSSIRGSLGAGIEGLQGLGSLSKGRVNTSKSPNKSMESVARERAIPEYEDDDAEASQEVEGRMPMRREKNDASVLLHLERYLQKQNVSNDKIQLMIGNIHQLVQNKGQDKERQQNRKELILQSMISQPKKELQPSLDQALQGLTLVGRDNRNNRSVPNLGKLLTPIEQPNNRLPPVNRLEPQAAQENPQKKLGPIGLNIKQAQKPTELVSVKKALKDGVGAKTERTNPVLAKMMAENMQQFAHQKSDKIFSVARYGSTEKQRVERAGPEQVSKSAKETPVKKEESKAKAALMQLRKSQPVGSTETLGGWSVVDALKQNDGLQFESIEEAAGDPIHEGMYQMGNLQMEKNVITKNLGKDEETMLKLYDHINSNTALRQQLLSIMQETVKISKIEVEQNVLENFQVFKEFFEDVMTGHSNCGANCMHLRRFYEKLRFDPIVPTNRKPMAIPVSVIKQPMFNYQKV